MAKRICSISGCKRPHKSRGFCESHYRKHMKEGATAPRINNKVPRGEWSEWYITPKGYIQRYRFTDSGQEWQAQHRFAMEAKLGRPLRKGENVHHINGMRTDNRPENLELWVISQPAGQRLEDKVKWAKTFLEQYGYSVKPPLA